jgi:uncharacterized protein YjbI with pentapeptide repeats
MSDQANTNIEADFVLDLHGAFVRRTDLSYANLEGANLAHADAAHASFRGAQLKGTNLKGTILKGADLRDAKGLTAEQLAEAVIDETTLLPDYIMREQLAKLRR